MIKSLTFTGEFGYITDKIPEPECYVRGYDYRKHRGKKEFTKNELEEIKIWEKDHEEWEKNKDSYKNPHLVKNLLNRKFTFEPNKINLIFGPNASGKTTILKAIAGKGGTTDGYARLVEPLDLHHFNEDLSYDCVLRYINKLMMNSADIEWDGAPIYYDNFANRKTYGTIGDMCGSVLGDDIMTEIQYTLAKDRISLGQNSIYLLNRLFGIAQNHMNYADIFNQYVEADGTIKKLRCNDIWAKSYKLQLSYYLGFEKSLVKSPSTFLFDELDKSLDISNIYTLYTQALPRLVKETDVQVIIISHSPLVLSDKIRNSEIYNFISIDDQYTKDCLDHLGKLF